jgi:hypothetical protein
MQFKEIIADYNDNHTKPITTEYQLNFAKGISTYNYHLALKG